MTEQEQAKLEGLVKQNKELTEANTAVGAERDTLLQQKEELYVENKNLVTKVGELEGEVEKLEHTTKSLSGKLKKAKKGVKEGPPIVRH